MPTPPTLLPLESPRWRDYALLDSGDGQKLERFGAYVTIRPEAQALWTPALPASEWRAANAVFKPTGEESGGHWDAHTPLPEAWQLSYPLDLRSSGDVPSYDLRFSVMTTPGRHVGLFPEAAANWDFTAQLIAQRKPAARVLNLFGYTGLATLAAAAAGASVTHVDASKKSVTWARENQALSHLAGKPVRWIVDDALKYAQREQRRASRYEGIILDPPKFGRGPKGEVWELYRSLPRLMQSCRDLLSDSALFIVLTLYAVPASAIHLQQMLAEMRSGRGGVIDGGELVTREQSAGRLLSHAVFARWRAA